MTTNRVCVNAAPNAVYAVLLDAYAYPKWVVGSKAVRGVDADWPAIGCRFYHTVGAPGVDIKDSSQLLELETDRRVVLEVRFRPVGVGVVSMGLEALDNGRTRITMCEWPKSGPVRVWWSKPMDALTSVRNAISLRRLARLSERRTAPIDG